MSQLLQQTASNPKNSAWVFASAGSGKTKILTDRVLRLLLSGVAPNKILCLTFTKAAASEMEKRINSALGNWVICDDATLEKQLHDLSGKIPSDEELKKARTLFVKILDSDSKIKAQTIHSFCQTLIKIFPFEANVKPNFEVLEENQEKLLIKTAQSELRKKALMNENLKNLITKITATLHDESLLDLTSELLDKKENLIFLKEKFFGIEGVIEEIFAQFGLTKKDNEEKIFSEFLIKADHDRNNEIAQILEHSALATNVTMAKKIQEFFAAPSLKKFPLYYSVFFTQEGSLRKIPGKNIPDDFKAELAELADELIEFSEKINSLKIANDSANILRLCNEILEIYSQLKNQSSKLDYNDLIIESNRLLSNSQHRDWIKMKMDSGFDHILIDESQDTNHQQWNIIKALSEDFFSGLSASPKDRSIFIVGDEKQSIFSFQGSDANISADIFSYFEEKLGKNLKKIELNNSFRSKKEILAAVDKVFADEARQKAITKIGKFQNHQAIRTGSGLVEIWPQVKLDKKEKTDEGFEWKLDFSGDEEEKEAAIMAKMVSAKIQNLVEKEKRNYGDVMILLRNRTNKFLPELIKSFHQFQIPFTSISRIRFSASLLIQDLLAASKFALLAEDDLNLASLLKSAFFLISEEELLEICVRKNQEKISLFAAIQDEKIKNQLTEITQKSRELNAFEFFYFLLCEKNYRRNFISYFGSESAEILDKLLLHIFEFQKNFSPNLQKFLEFVEKIDPEISLSGEENNRVKITTVHSSKGLQAPIIFMPDCCYNPRQFTSNKGQIFWANDLPLWCVRKSGENQMIRDARAIRFDEMSQEYLRLLYVAMTRAADELYIGGFGNISAPNCWFEIVKGALPENVVEEVNTSSLVIPEKAGIQNVREELDPRFREDDTERKEATSTPINLAQIKGEVIHKVFEIFGKNYREEKNWLKVLAQKIVQKAEILSEKDHHEIIELTSKFLDSKLFSEVFSGDVKCEIELAADGNFGRIDLLIEKEKEILIIDYKSDETLPDKTPQEYLQQLTAYKKLAQKLYPSKKISGAILWVRFLKMDLVL